MPLLGFQKQFAPLVESGEKRQTIRAYRKDGKDPKPMAPSNTCFSMVDGDGGGRSILVSHAFKWNAAETKFDRTATVDLEPTKASADAALRWASSIWTEMLG